MELGNGNRKENAVYVTVGVRLKTVKRKSAIVDNWAQSLDEITS